MTAEERHALGFGCFWFGVTADAPATFTTGDYLNAVDRALRACPSVEEVSIDTDSDRSVTWERLEEPHDIDEDFGYFPSLEFTRTAFTVFIPRRMQDELMPLGGPSSTGTERFSVVIEDAWRLPVTFIELIRPADGGRPSDGVVVVKELLTREVTGENAWVRFQVLGPSPAHVDLYLQPMPGRQSNGDSVGDSAGRPAFSRVAHSVNGYHRLVYEYDAEVIDSDGVVERARSTLSGELDVLYAAKQASNAHARTWDELAKKVNALIQAQRTPGLRGLAARTFGAGPMDDAVIGLSEFEMEYLARDRALQETYDAQYDVGTMNFLEPMVTREFETRFTFPIEQVGALLQRLEQRRLTDRELLIIALSSGVGGVIGAAATLIVG